MKLTDNHELNKMMFEELANWGRWGSDHDTGDELMYGIPRTAREYVPEAGHLFDRLFAGAPIDEQAGRETERIICIMREIDPHAREALIAKFAHSRKPVPRPSKGRVQAAMQSYYEVKMSVEK